MEGRESLIEPLFERAEEYSKMNYELLKMKSLDKAASVTSILFSRLLFVALVLFFVFALTVAAALWLGTLLGQNYYGFLVMATLYAIGGVLLLLLHPMIKSRVANAIIVQMLN